MVVLLITLIAVAVGIPAILRLYRYPNAFRWAFPNGPQTGRTAQYLAEGHVTDYMRDCLVAAVALAAAQAALYPLRLWAWTCMNRVVEVNMASNAMLPATVSERCYVPRLRDYQGYVYAIPPVELGEQVACGRVQCGKGFEVPARSWWAMHKARGKRVDSVLVFGCGHAFHPACLQNRFDMGLMRCPSHPSQGDKLGDSNVLPRALLATTLKGP